MTSRADGTVNAVSVRNVTKRYGDTEAVSGLDLDVPRGTIFGFIGPSGSGKTTAIRMFTGIDRPTEGEVQVLDRDPVRFTPDERARIGYLPQLSVLFPNLSLQENLSFVASIYGMPLRRRGRMRQVMNFVELWGDRRKLLRQASGGMQRRLALAAALVHEPELLFLDEPTAGIDPLLRRKFWERFGELRDQGRTLFVTTQYVGEAAYCDFVGVIHEGRLVAVDTPAGLRRHAFGGDVLEVRAAEPLSASALADLRSESLVRSCRPWANDPAAVRVIVEQAEAAIPRLTEWFERRGIAVESMHPEQVSFDDVFVELVQGGQW